MRPPLTSRDFQRAAGQRFTVAELLLDNEYTLDATYLCGYSIECSLKALILEHTPTADRATMLKRITAGKRMHDLELLVGLIPLSSLPLPIKLIRRLRRSTWSTDLRYCSGRLDLGETRAFLKTAKAVYDWVEGQLS